MCILYIYIYINIYICIYIVFRCKGIFIVGVALIGVMPGGSNAIVSANAIDDYSYVNARDSDVTQGVQIARCVTGLGPSASEDNSVLGGVYFNGSRLAFESCGGSSRLIHPRAAGLGNPGVINIVQCSTPFTTALEGIYTCTMMNSSMMEQSIRFGVYFDVRSESLDLYMPSFIHLFLYTAAPVIDALSSSVIIITIGSSLTLNCTSQGSPPDTFTWRKDNDPTVLQSTSITAVDYTSTSAVFRADYVIDNITESDIGTYTCIVINPIGSDNATITIVTSKLLMQ